MSKVDVWLRLKLPARYAKELRTMRKAAEKEEGRHRHRQRHKHGRKHHHKFGHKHDEDDDATDEENEVDLLNDEAARRAKRKQVDANQSINQSINQSKRFQNMPDERHHLFLSPWSSCSYLAHLYSVDPPGRHADGVLAAAAQRLQERHGRGHHPRRARQARPRLMRARRVRIISIRLRTPHAILPWSLQQQTQ